MPVSRVNAWVTPYLHQPTHFRRFSPSSSASSTPAPSIAASSSENRKDSGESKLRIGIVVVGVWETQVEGRFGAAQGQFESQSQAPTGGVYTTLSATSSHPCTSSTSNHLSRSHATKMLILFHLNVLGTSVSGRACGSLSSSVLLWILFGRRAPHVPVDVAFLSSYLKQFVRSRRLLFIGHIV